MPSIPLLLLPSHLNSSDSSARISLLSLYSNDVTITYSEITIKELTTTTQRTEERVQTHDENVLGSELVTNGDFASWATPTDADNWTEVKAGGSSINREDVEVYSGSHSCRIDIDALNSNGQIQKIGGLAINLTAGKTYKMTRIYKYSAIGKVFDK